MQHILPGLIIRSACYGYLDEEGKPIAIPQLQNASQVQTSFASLCLSFLCIFFSSGIVIGRG